MKKKKSTKTCTTLSVYYLKDWIRFSLISGWLFLDTSAEAPRYWILSFPCAYVNCSTIPTHIRHYVGCGLRVFDDGWQLLSISLVGIVSSLHENYNCFVFLSSFFKIPAFIASR